jgi:glycosyltransferase involved in cell wall biosynthesis
MGGSRSNVGDYHTCFGYRVVLGNYMRILYLTNAAHIGGGNRSLLTLWQALKARGVSPVAVCPTGGPMVEACRELEIPCEVVEYYQPSVRQPFRTWRSYRQWCRLLVDQKIDLIHANDPFGARSICLAARRIGLPVVCHVQYPPTADFLEWVFRNLPKPKCFIYCSRALLEEVGPAMRRACPRAEQIVIHNCTVVENFRTDISARSGRPRVGIVANLIPVKGHLDFLSMARELKTSGIDAEYWVIGGDVHGNGYGTSLEEHVRKLDLEESVSFLGHRSDVAELLAQLDVVVCSSHVEPFGICLIEAMASGKPVVATHVGGIPEVVEDGRTGMLVPPGTPSELARAVKLLIQNAELRREMGTAGRKRVEGHFSHETHANKVLAIYQSLLTV